MKKYAKRKKFLIVFPWVFQMQIMSVTIFSYFFLIFPISHFLFFRDDLPNHSKIARNLQKDNCHHGLNSKSGQNIGLFVREVKGKISDSKMGCDLSVAMLCCTSRKHEYKKNYTHIHDIYTFRIPNSPEWVILHHQTVSLVVFTHSHALYPSPRTERPVYYMETTSQQLFGDGQSSFLTYHPSGLLFQVLCCSKIGKYSVISILSPYFVVFFYWSAKVHIGTCGGITKSTKHGTLSTQCTEAHKREEQLKLRNKNRYASSRAA